MTARAIVGAIPTAVFGDIMKLYYGTYGHHLSGKLYVYWGDDNLRTGQQVVAPVTNPKSGKNYNTMFTIARAQSPANAQNEVNRLSEEGIFIKTISGRDTLSLPGGMEFNTKIEWKRDSDRRYREKYHLPEPQETETEKPQESITKKSIQRVSAPKKRKKKKRKSVLTKKNARKITRLMQEAAKQITPSERARANLVKKKSAADSFNARRRIQNIRQRKPFIEENEDETE